MTAFQFSIMTKCVSFQEAWWWMFSCTHCHRTVTTVADGLSPLDPSLFVSFPLFEL